MDTTKQTLMVTRNNAEAALERGGLSVDERIALMNVSRRAQKELDTIAETQRQTAPPFVGGGPLSDALARFFSPYEY